MVRNGTGFLLVAHFNTYYFSIMMQIMYINQYSRLSCGVEQSYESFWAEINAESAADLVGNTKRLKSYYNGTPTLSEVSTISIEHLRTETS